MFARNVSIHLKYNMLSEYGHVFDSQILPYSANKRALGMKSRSPCPVAWM